jgi:hypothetical protein
MRSLMLVEDAVAESNSIRLSDLPHCKRLHSYYSTRAPPTRGSSSNVVTAQFYRSDDKDHGNYASLLSR